MKDFSKSSYTLYTFGYVYIFERTLNSSPVADFSYIRVGRHHHPLMRSMGEGMGERRERKVGPWKKGQNTLQMCVLVLGGRSPLLWVGDADV